MAITLKVAAKRREKSFLKPSKCAEAIGKTPISDSFR